MKNETVVSAITTINKVKHRSNITIDWSGMTDDDVQALAQRSLIIRKQNKDRMDGVIPESSYTIKAADYKLGVRIASKPNVSQLLAELTPEERTKLLEQYL